MYIKDQLVLMNQTLKEQYCQKEESYGNKGSYKRFIGYIYIYIYVY